MSRSIGKAAAAAFILGCGVAGLCLSAVADDPQEPPRPPVPQFNPLGLNPAAFRSAFTSKTAPEPPVVRPPSEKERQIAKRIRAGWQARHERMRSFSIAWDIRSNSRTDRNADSPESHTELWIDDGFRSRLQVSSPPDAKPHLFTFDGMTARSWNPETRAGEVWNGEPDKGLAPRDTIIWRVTVDPLCCEFLDTSSAEIHVPSENAIIGDRHCVKLRIPMKSRSPDSGLFDTLWIDPARDNVIVGWERGIPDTPSAFVSIEYTLDKQRGWLPSRWRMTTPASSGESTTRTRIAVNEQYSASMFRQTFPPGAQVDDRKISERYVIAPDGSKTHVVKYYPLEVETIYDSLNEITDFIVDPEPLKDALEFIAQRYHIRTAIDDRAVRQGLIEPAAVVQTQKHGIKLKELLEILLKQSSKPLRYEIRNDVVTVISARK